MCLLDKAISACIHLDIWDEAGNISHYRSYQLCYIMEPSGLRLPCMTQASSGWGRGPPLAELTKDRPRGWVRQVSVPQAVAWL